jgi:hypothetical protein
MTKPKITETVPDVSDEAEHARQCITNGIRHAESTYTNPVIRIFMHPDVHDIITMGDENLVAMDGYDVIISEYATLRVIVCGVNAKDINRNRPVVNTQY